MEEKEDSFGAEMGLPQTLENYPSMVFLSVSFHPLSSSSSLKIFWLLKLQNWSKLDFWKIPIGQPWILFNSYSQTIIIFTNIQTDLQGEDRDLVRLIQDHLWSWLSLEVQMGHNQVFETRNERNIRVYLLQRYCLILY